MTRVTASPSRSFNSSSAPAMIARKTCHHCAPKLMCWALADNLWRISAIPLAWCVILAITRKQHRIAVT